MNRFTCAIFASVIAASTSPGLATAEEAFGNAEQVQVCEALGGLAEEIMSARQFERMSLGGALELAGDHEVAQILVAAAWETPVRSTLTMKAKEIAQLGYDARAECLALTPD